MLKSPRSEPGGPTDCDAVEALAFAACDGELTGEEVVVINSHLVDCRSCLARVTRDATFVRAIRRAVSLDTAPRSLRDRVAQLLLSHAAENAST